MNGRLGGAALLSTVENLAGALFAAAAAGRDAQFELQILEGGAPLMCMTNDVAVGNSVANTDNHGASRTTSLMTLF